MASQTAQNVRDLIAHPVTVVLANADAILMTAAMLGTGFTLTGALTPALGKTGAFLAALPVVLLAGYVVTRLTDETLPGRRRPFVEAAGDLADRVALWAGWQLIEPATDDDDADRGC